MERRKLLAVCAMLVLIMVIPGLAAAAVVGRFTEVTGQVDVLKQGKLPAAAAKVGDGLEPGDVIRTKSKSKAQMKFVDDTVITLAAESRMAVADYEYEPTRYYRRAVIRIFRGMVHTVVTRLLTVEEPGFITETHSAVMGVRGTESYTLLMPNFTTEYLISGVKEIKSSNPNIPAVLLLHAMEFTQIVMNQQPQLPKPITPEMLQMLKGMMDTGVRGTALMTEPPIGAPKSPISEFKLPVSPEQLTPLTGDIRKSLPPPLLSPPPPPTPVTSGSSSGP
jgi:hypothetical protein